jgi:predicted ribosomally synthesized peptide with SipW-like signal peptide
MTNKRTTKVSLISSAVALALCLAMLLGTTLAWFTDTVTSSSNIIASGTLNVEMHWAEGTEDPGAANWQDASQGAIFNNDKWEPGYTEVRHIKIENKGTLDLQYKIVIVANGEVSDLADVIDVYYLDPAVQITGRDQLAASSKIGTLTKVLEQLDETGTGFLAKGATDTITLALKMQESAGNEYQGTKLCDGGFSVQLLATQAPSEYDSFGNDYDQNAASAFFPGFQGGSGGIAVPLDEQRYTTEEVTVDFGDVTVVIPVGVKLAEGFTSLTASVVTKNTSESNVQLNETEKMRPSDVHIEGVAEDNATAMLITLKHYLTTGLNSGALTLYHVEDGTAVPMTHTATPANHNEFTYDPATGDVTLALASFSEVAVVADTNNPWDGDLDISWYNASATELTIYNADQLAGFAAIVDGKAKGIAQDSFNGKIVKLNNNIYLSKDINFDPIGWGYVNTEWNRDGADGKVFMGTFDGNGKTIFDLYQSGWDLEEKTGTDYTYTNCGFGLFAAASNATFKNLTISGAYVRAECVEMGILVGLSQGSCTYENINIHNSKIANYQRPTGGLIGEISPLNGGGETNITNVEIGSDVVVGSLWGDFDAPCGGVIGARWDDSNTSTVNMKNVTVGCRMDVYNDITSAYQWHAYRRAGMLIGNTEMTVEGDPHKAAAPFLKCSDVYVYYGDWINYTYCEFNNHNSRYPWVRTQAGENCTAFSNPRWGVPNDVNGKLVTDMNHEHQEGDECGILRQFTQLYGGGQGVYGQDQHPGVTTIKYKYSITYVNAYEVLDIVYVTDNSKPVKVGSDQAQKLVIEWAKENIGKQGEDFVFDNGWMNAGSTKISEIDANNTKDIVLYPYFDNPYTARFVDQNGNVIAYCFFHAKDITKLEATRAAAEAALPDLGEDLEFDYWKVHITDNNGKVTKEEDYAVNNFKGYEKDVTVYPVYLFKGDVNLVPVDTDSDGIIDHYQVAGYSDPNGQAMVEIPASVNGKPILQINQNAFSSYDGVHSIVVPNGVTIQKNAFTSGNKLGSGEEITIYFEGTRAQWNALNKETGWDYGIGNNSRVFFLKDGKVDTTQGYLQVGSRKWNEKTDFASVKEQYSGYCDCKEGTGGDTGHIYVRVNADGTETIMQHNANGTPVNEQGVEIYWGVIKEGWLGSLGEEKGLRDDDTNDTYKRYRPDAIYW